MDVITSDERVLKDPEPVVTVTNGASSVDFNVRPWTKNEDYWPTRWDLLERIKDRLDERYWYSLSSNGRSFEKGHKIHAPVRDESHRRWLSFFGILNA